MTHFSLYAVTILVGLSLLSSIVYVLYDEYKTKKRQEAYWNKRKAEDKAKLNTNI